MDIANYLIDKWTEAILTVNFHLEEGQVIDFIHPKNSLSCAIKKKIAYMSFPDSNSFSTEGELYYVFHVKNDEQEILYCYVYFTQVKDLNNARGYHQKSLVIVSTIKMIKVFSLICKFVNKEYRESGMNNSILADMWSDLNKNKTPDELFENGKIASVKIRNKELKVKVKRVCRSYR